MEYTMALTRRHEFPEEAKGAIYPGGENAKRLKGETGTRHYERLDAWAEFTIPADCTKLKVYMSGYKVLWLSLRRVCKRRGIKAIYMFPKSNKVKKRINCGETPKPGDFMSVRKLRF